MELVKELRRRLVRTAEEMAIPRQHVRAQEEVNMLNQITKARAKTKAKARTGKAAGASTFRVKVRACPLCKVSGVLRSGISMSSSKRMRKRKHHHLLHHRCFHLLPVGEIKVIASLG